MNWRARLRRSTRLRNPRFRYGGESWGTCIFLPFESVGKPDRVVFVVGARMTASLNEVRSTLAEWQNKSRRVEVKVWSYGISVILRGVLVRCDQQMLVIAESQTNFQLNFDVVKEARASGDSVELELTEGPSILIYTVAI